MIEVLKKKINKSCKEIQENTSKRLKETNKSLKEIQENSNNS